MEPVRISTTAGLEYQPLTFQIPIVPVPHPQCTDLLPSDERSMKQYTAAQSQAQRDQAHAQRMTDTKQKKGLFNKLDAFCTDVAHNVEKGINQVATSATTEFHQQNEDMAFNRLRKNFPQLVTEKLAGDYKCKLWTQNGVLPGYLQLTNQHFLFIGDQGFAFGVPLNQVVSVQRLIAAQTKAPNPPHFIPINDATVEAQALQLFVTSGQIFLFNEFFSIRGMPATIVSEAFNVLDHMWRAAAIVPNPQFQYLPSESFKQPQLTIVQPQQAAGAAACVTGPPIAPPVQQQQPVFPINGPPPQQPQQGGQYPPPQQQQGPPFAPQPGYTPQSAFPPPQQQGPVTGVPLAFAPQPQKEAS